MGKLAIHVATNTGRLPCNWEKWVGYVGYRVPRLYHYHIWENGCLLKNYEVNMFAYLYP